MNMWKYQERGKGEAIKPLSLRDRGIIRLTALSPQVHMHSRMGAAERGRADIHLGLE